MTKRFCIKYVGIVTEWWWMLLREFSALLPSLLRSHQWTALVETRAGIILCIHPANGRRRYSLFGCVHTQNDFARGLYVTSSLFPLLLLIRIFQDGWNQQLGHHLSIYGDSHYKDKTVIILSYLYNENTYTGKMTSLYWEMDHWIFSILVLQKKKTETYFYFSKVSSAWVNLFNCSFYIFICLNLDVCCGMATPICYIWQDLTLLGWNLIYFLQQTRKVLCLLCR